ncbi:hypothetical protein [Paraflavitalea pollutisoli]|uniref:hypothetical protein n=1 Tax=Paraflavitalea pollutisoli TaxID=3034143 RepID=UPI0023EB4620|nr:hypothetical protein [Paraflavitalea sp. H1-2-19X]
MKKFLSVLFVALLLAGASFAQCDKHVVYSSEKQEFIGTDGQVEDIKTDALTLEFSQGKIVLNAPGKGDALTGIIKETDCQWKTLYKEGKAVYKLDFQKPQSDETSGGSITIEAKDGVLTILVEIAKMEGRKVKLIVSKYEEK